MNLNRIELVIPTEDMRYICKESNAQSVVLLDVCWNKFNIKRLTCSL